MPIVWTKYRNNLRNDPQVSFFLKYGSPLFKRNFKVDTTVKQHKLPLKKVKIKMFS